MGSIQGLKQWQTARAPITTEDTPLTDYKPSDFTDAVQQKSISVHPATAVILRVLGKDADNDTIVLIVSGWMDPNSEKGPGPGHRLWRGEVKLGSKSWADVPLGDGKWVTGTWQEADTYDFFTDAADYDMVGATVLDAVQAPDLIINQEACLILPTLGYSHLLLEILNMNAAGEMTEVGILWRQLDFANLNLNPYPDRIVRTNEEP